jgi:UDP-2,3-diacylglucosamine pyrophosphatase LpxH
MGFSFNANHGNLVVFLTTPAAEPPRVERSILTEFLGGLVDAAHRGQSEGHQRRGRGWNPRSEDSTYTELISADARWLRLISLEAQRAASALEAFEQSGEAADNLLPPRVVAQSLAPLAQLFSQFRLYALLLARSWSAEDVSRELRNAAAQLAYSGEDVLVLFPRGGGDRDQSSLDTLPAFSTAIAQKDRWPGILFWSQHGAAAFASEGTAIEAAAMFARSLSDQTDADLDRAIDRLADRTPRRILHLSDLHFGSEHASINAEYVEAELSEVANSASRIVITGDLIETPGDDAAANFRRFAGSLYRVTKKPVIVVPGNHDQKWHGNALGGLGQDLTQVAQLSWSPHVVDDDLQTVFLCFNSSLKGNLARGQTGDRQRTRVAGEHRNALAVRPELREYLTVALIHHHPFSFETTPTTWFQRALVSMRLSDEPTLKMEDAEAFVDWCARWRVSAVLHGHKHVPRYETRVVTPEGAPAHEVTAIGCGSTLGAEGSPLSYCLLSWDPHASRWSTTFYESRGGGPFLPALITVTRAASIAA